jgi:hypothetical protein
LRICRAKQKHTGKQSCAFGFHVSNSLLTALSNKRHVSGPAAMLAARQMVALGFDGD